MPLADFDADGLSKIPLAWATPPSEMISQLPRGNVQLDYLDHAQTTLALIEIDPEWTYDFRAVADDGLPRIRQVGDRLYLGITLYVLGKPMPGIGSCLTTSPDALKELIGDALRNAAMRYGIALSLWSKLEMPQSLPSEASLPPSEVPARYSVAEEGYAALEGDRERLRERVSALPPGAKGVLRASMISQHLSLDKASTEEDIRKIGILIEAAELAEEGRRKRLEETSEFDSAT